MAETADIVCASCGAQLQDRTAFCPACGAAAPGMGSTGAGDGEIAALLAAASRALKRRDWATAREKCTEAIAREHDNRSALALMGDICMEQHSTKTPHRGINSLSTRTARTSAWSTN